jgi:hypothetical protein
LDTHEELSSSQEVECHGRVTVDMMI